MWYKKAIYAFQVQGDCTWISEIIGYDSSGDHLTFTHMFPILKFDTSEN